MCARQVSLEIKYARMMCGNCRRSQQVIPMTLGLRDHETASATGGCRRYGNMRSSAKDNNHNPVANLQPTPSRIHPADHNCLHNSIENLIFPPTGTSSTRDGIDWLMRIQRFESAPSHS